MQKPQDSLSFIQGKKSQLKYMIAPLDEDLDGIQKGDMILIGALNNVGSTSFVVDKFIINTIFMNKILPNYNKSHVGFPYEIIYYNLKETKKEMYNRIVIQLLQFYYPNLVESLNLNYSNLNYKEIDETTKMTISDLYAELNSKSYRFENYLKPNNIHDLLYQVALNNGNFQVDTKYIATSKNYTEKDPNKHIIVVIDNLNCIATEEKQTYREAINAISRTCRAFSNLCKFTIVALYTFNEVGSDNKQLRNNEFTPKLKDFNDLQFVVDSNIILGLFNPKSFANILGGQFLDTPITNGFRTLHLLKSNLSTPFNRKLFRTVNGGFVDNKCFYSDFLKNE